jgi:Fe-S-cluster-containing hydrogenase component 2
MIQNIIERSALLIALIESFPKGVKRHKLNQALPNWTEHVNFLIGRGIDIDVNDKEIVLKKPVYYSLYQSVPPEIRKDVEEILWKIVDREPIVEAALEKQKVFRPLDDALLRFSLTQSISKHKFDDKGNKWLTRGPEKFPLACINCVDPPCMTYGIEAFGQTDAFASQVCPSDVIKQSLRGIVTIDQGGCGGCMLCLMRCPINAIVLKEGVAHKLEYDDVPNSGSYVVIEHVDFDKKKEITKKALEDLSAINTRFSIDLPVKDILDNFEVLSGTKLNWDQDRYYIWVRNCLRELGLEALYTGSPGKLRRADITIRKPFYAGIEVKSPAEGDIDVGAVRQAADAAREVQEAYKQNAYCAVIGKEIGRGAHKHAISWYDNYRVKIPLIRGRYLLYLLLKHRTDLPQHPIADVKRLFTEFVGRLGRDELVRYHRQYFKSRRDQIVAENVSLPMPPVVNEKLQSKNWQQALDTLEALERSSINELSICFPNSKRTARGSYASK